MKKTVKKLILLSIVFTMMITGLVHYEIIGHAVDLPSVKDFATMEQLKTLTTSDDVSLYYGKDDTKWDIVGSQNDNIVLMAQSPIQTNTTFNNTGNEISDSSLWDDCFYMSGDVSSVYPNHYGSSAIRQTLKNLKNTYFSDFESKGMVSTYLYNKDEKNNGLYGMSDYLYLPYGDINSDTISVGENSSDQLDSGIKIKKSTLKTNNFFLRTPASASGQVLSVNTDLSTVATWVTAKLNIVPAFQLKGDRYLFASRVPVTSTSGKVALDDTMTLRYKSQLQGTATVSTDKQSITFDNVPYGVDVVIQNSEGAYRYSVAHGNSTRTAKDYNLSSFDNSQIWLESTDTGERCHYATMAVQEEPENDVNLPAKTDFALCEELKKFNTASDNDKNMEETVQVYLGNYKQKWIVTGSQNDHLVLYAMSSLQDCKFNNDNSNKDVSLNDDIGVYPSGTSISQVYPNHYGSSLARKTLINLSLTYFTTEEQKLILPTKVYTKDSKNSVTYYTNDKLYLPHEAEGAYGASTDTLSVGENSEDNLYAGLPVYKNYWATDTYKWFFLTAPARNTSVKGFNYSPTSKLANTGRVDVTSESGLRPACQIDMSKVLFGSTTPAVNKEGQLDKSEAMTLRYQSDNIGTVNVTTDYKKAVLTNVPAGTYLVAQNNQGSWSKAVSGSTSIQASDLGLTSFKGYQVWIENTNTDQRITSASLAGTQEPTKESYHVEIKESTGLQITSHNESQDVEEGQAISTITVELKKGYTISDDDLKNIQGLNGLVVSKTDKGLTISGIPSGNVDLTLPQATRKKAKTPEVTVSEDNHQLGVTVTNKNDAYGDEEYSLDQSHWQTSNIFDQIQPGQTYTIYVRFSESEEYGASDITTVQYTTRAATYVVSIPKEVKADGSIQQIKINQNEDFYLGKNGYVDVMIEDTGDIKNGNITLSRLNDAKKTTVSAQLFINNQLFTNLSQSVIQIVNKTDYASLSVKKPENQSILAGQYKGQITFKISYKEK